MSADKKEERDLNQVEAANHHGLGGAKPVSRREFLKVTGLAGAVLATGAGLGGLVSACGSGAGTTTTQSTAPATTASSAATSSTVAPATTTSVTSAAVMGREVKLGVVSPLTGDMAVFGAADKWSIQITEKALGDSTVLGDGQAHKVSFVIEDTQSDANRASQVAGDLITNGNVDLLIADGGVDTIIPAATQAETLGKAFICNNCPWQAFVFQRKATLQTVFKYTFLHGFGIEQTAVAFLVPMTKLATNKQVGMLFPNNADTQAWIDKNTGVQVAFKAAGFPSVIPSPYTIGSEDFTAEISTYKKNACEIIMGSNLTADFTNFWKQANQQSLQPKMVIEVQGVQQYADMVALGQLAVGIIVGLLWCKGLPWTDVVTGLSNADLAASFEAYSGELWNNFIGIHALKSWALDVLKRTQNLDSVDAIVTAIKATKMDLPTGPIDMTAAVDPTGLHVTENVYKQPFYAAQIVPGAQTGTKYQFDRVLVGAADFAGLQISDPKPLQYS